jgi:hypothetical protein
VDSILLPETGVSFSLLVAWFVPFLSPLAAFLWLGCELALLLRRRFAILCLGFLLTPYSFWFLSGCRSYFGGTARYYSDSGYTGRGMSGLGLVNSHPKLRCERMLRGDSISGDEWLTKDANNDAIELLTCLFGPEPGAYDGPFPSENQAWGILRHGIPVPLSELSENSITCGTATFPLEQNASSYLRQFTGADDFAPTGELEVALFRMRCLLIEAVDGGDAAIVILVDADTGKPFHFYDFINRPHP